MQYKIRINPLNLGSLTLDDCKKVVKQIPAAYIKGHKAKTIMIDIISNDKHDISFDDSKKEAEKFRTKLFASSDIGDIFSITRKYPK